MRHAPTRAMQRSMLGSARPRNTVHHRQDAENPCGTPAPCRSYDLTWTGDELARMVRIIAAPERRLPFAALQATLSRCSRASSSLMIGSNSKTARATCGGRMTRRPASSLRIIFVEKPSAVVRSRFEDEGPALLSESTMRKSSATSRMVEPSPAGCSSRPSGSTVKI